MASSGQHVVRTDTGKRVVRTDGKFTISDGADDCGAVSCGGCNPAPEFLAVSFSGVTLAGCQDTTLEFPDMCFAADSGEVSFEVTGDINAEFILALDPDQPDSASSCRYFGWFPDAVTVRVRKRCDGEVVASLAWLYIEVTITGGTVTVVADALLHGFGVFHAADIDGRVTIFDGFDSGANPCESATIVINDLVTLDDDIHEGQGGYGGTATVSPTGIGDDAGVQVAPVSCPATCDRCASTLTAVVSGHSDPSVNGSYTLTRSGCSWSGTNGYASMTITCDSGVWRAEIPSVCFNSGGGAFYNDSILNAACPPSSGWQMCRACDEGGETMSMSLS